MDTLKAWCRSLDRTDMHLIASAVATVVVWWIFIGRKKYSTKGMR